jgi:hypothetical protein
LATGVGGARSMAMGARESRFAKALSRP